MSAWFDITNAHEVASPALLISPELVERNIRRAIDIVGDSARLRPHVKTHKLPEMVRMHVAMDVTKFKCATIAEAEMTAAAGASEVLIAYQPVGPNIRRVLALTSKFPNTNFQVVADDLGAVDALNDAFASSGRRLDVFLDVDCGMHRTGVSGAEAEAVFRRIASSPTLHAAGLHAYDGHIHDSDVEERTRRSDEAFARVTALQQRLVASGLDIPLVIAGGTPTFPMHARRAGIECSPGTYVFWDFGYAEGMPDLPFEIAAVLLTRVVSRPAPNRLCLDLGHKAVAPENPQPRVRLMNVPQAMLVMQSEEHLVVETPNASAFQVGDVVFAIPRHICPTVALHSEVVVVQNRAATERWRVTARDRALTI